MNSCMKKNSQYLLIDTAVLPDVFLKVIEVKKILGKGNAKTVNEAVQIVGISRSAYYKYKDYVYPFYDATTRQVVTLFFVLEDFSGILSKIINKIAAANANILTINQNIPINDLADVTISIETHGMTKSVRELMDEISEIDGVKRHEILAR